MNFHRLAQPASAILISCLLCCSCSRTPTSHVSESRDSEQDKDNASYNEGHFDSVHAAWIMLLEAFRNQDVDKIRLLTTDSGLDSLNSRSSKEERLEWFERQGDSLLLWRTYDWEFIDEDHVSFSLGPVEVESGLEFENTQDGWKLHKYTPGY